VKEWKGLDYVVGKGGNRVGGEGGGGEGEGEGAGKRDEEQGRSLRKVGLREKAELLHFLERGGCKEGKGRPYPAKEKKRVLQQPEMNPKNVWEKAGGKHPFNRPICIKKRGRSTTTTDEKGYPFK